MPDHAPPLPATPGVIEVDRNGLEVLDPAECARLLASSTFGRIGITVSALPTILPINYRLVDGQKPNLASPPHARRLSGGA